MTELTSAPETSEHAGTDDEQTLMGEYALLSVPSSILPPHATMAIGQNSEPRHIRIGSRKRVDTGKLRHPHGHVTDARDWDIAKHLFFHFLLHARDVVRVRALEAYDDGLCVVGARKCARGAPIRFPRRRGVTTERGLLLNGDGARRKISTDRLAELRGRHHVAHAREGALGDRVGLLHLARRGLDAAARGDHGDRRSKEKQASPAHL
jgi:hypothetical protein